MGVHMILRSFVKWLLLHLVDYGQEDKLPQAALQKQAEVRHPQIVSAGVALQATLEERQETHKLV